MEIGTAGVPIDLAITRDYDLIFSTLSESGIDVFFPTTLYEEIPFRQGLNFEADFYPPPFGSATGEIYELARSYGIEIAFSADLLYPVGDDLPASGNDPLQALIDAGARDIIHSVFNYDEPVLHGHDVSKSQALYEHVKAIDPTLVVQQVHAAVGDEADPSTYLASVLDHSEWADAVGFNVYPIYTESGSYTPYSGGQIIEPLQALGDYVDWLNENLADKDHTMVLQAFQKADLYSNEWLNALPLEELAMSRDPTEMEMRAMLIAVSDVDSVFWFGPSFQFSQTESPWQSVLSISEMVQAGELNVEMGILVDVDTNASNIIAENSADGTFTGIQLEAIDPDQIDTVTYSLDDDRFRVDANGQVRVADGAVLDYETETSISLTATARSTDGSQRTLDLNVQLTNVVDAIEGTSFADSLLGDFGEDNIEGFAGDDIVDAGGGNDTVSAGSGNDLVYGGVGDDTIVSGDGNDIALGGDGNDNINGNVGNDTLLGEAGDDTIDGGLGDDLLLGGEGVDVIFGDAGIDRIAGQAGDDEIHGGAGNDSITGDGGRDTIYGDEGNDNIMGGADNDNITGGGGDDYLYGDSGDDLVAGNAGDDWLFGADGNDELSGGRGADYIFGELGNDDINGGDDADILLGQAGNDTINGGTGNDDIYLGTGDDTAKFDSGWGFDRVFDFSVSGADLLDMSSLQIAFDDLSITYDFTGTHIEYDGNTVHIFGSIDTLTEDEFAF